MFKWFRTIFSLGAPGLGSRHWQLFPYSLAAAFAAIVQLLLHGVVQYNREDGFFVFFGKVRYLISKRRMLKDIY